MSEGKRGLWQQPFLGKGNRNRTTFLLRCCEPQGHACFFCIRLFESTLMHRASQFRCFGASMAAGTRKNPGRIVPYLSFVADTIVLFSVASCYVCEKQRKGKV